MSQQSNPATVLVVDDAPENIEVLRRLLRDDYRVKVALNAERALKIANQDPQPDMILLDIMMPEVDGYEVCRRLKANPKTAPIPVIFASAKSQEEDEQKGLELGAVDYVSKPIRPAIVKARIRTHLALYDQNRLLEDKVHQRTLELEDTRLEIIRRLGRAAEFKDNETGLHVIRMSHYSRLIAEQLNQPEGWSNRVFCAAPMHDVGKIGIVDKVLLKPGPLDDDEWQQMRRHPAIGASIIGNHSSVLMNMAKEVALTHHEKWDGSGYPQGLSGEQIPLAGRVIAIADVFDALTSERPYKKAWPVEEAVAFINANSGKHFDPELVEVFNQQLPEMLKIKARYAEPEAKG